MTVDEIIETAGPICRRHHVRRLDLFGSRARGDSDANSDLDFCVLLEDLPPAEYSKQFFGLLHELEDAFHTTVDLLTDGSIRKASLRRSFNLTGSVSMDDRVQEWLEDILNQAREIRVFTDGMTFESYQADHKTQAAVERKCEIIGEALNRIRSVDEGFLKQIRDFRSIISFRNILAHGYDTVEDRIIWGIIENDLWKIPAARHPAMRRGWHTRPPVPDSQAFRTMPRGRIPLRRHRRRLRRTSPAVSRVFQRNLHWSFLNPDLLT